MIKQEKQNRPGCTSHPKPYAVTARITIGVWLTVAQDIPITFVKSAALKKADPKTLPLNVRHERNVPSRKAAGRFDHR